MLSAGGVRASQSWSQQQHPVHMCEQNHSEHCTPLRSWTFPHTHQIPFRFNGKYGSHLAQAKAQLVNENIIMNLNALGTMSYTNCVRGLRSDKKAGTLPAVSCARKACSLQSEGFWRLSGPKSSSSASLKQAAASTQGANSTRAACLVPVLGWERAGAALAENNMTMTTERVAVYTSA